MSPYSPMAITMAGIGDSARASSTRRLSRTDPAIPAVLTTSAPFALRSRWSWRKSDGIAVKS